jgi:glycosyltransferase involved in cell wall biosynthesis
MGRVFKSNDISIILTCYREGKLLLRALDSLKNQTVQGFTIIIVNDASTDKETCRILDALGVNDEYHIINHQMNMGLSAARNSGFRFMRTALAMPLDADDTLPKDAIEKTLEAFNRHPDADMVFGDYLIVSSDGASVKGVSCDGLANDQRELSLEALAKNWILMGQSPCKKALWSKINGYSMEFSNTVQDVDFWRRAALTGLKGYYAGTVLYHWHRSDTGMNNQVREEDYLPLRIKSMPFYDRFNPEYGLEMRQYVYRYYSARLQSQPLLDFLKQEAAYFTAVQKAKAQLMRAPILYKALRRLKTALYTPFNSQNSRRRPVE